MSQQPGGPRDVPGSGQQTYLQGFMGGLTKSATFARDRAAAGAASVQNAAAQRDWSREKGALNSVGTATRDAAVWTKDKAVAGASSARTAAQERDWSREKAYAASAGSAVKTGAVAASTGIKNGVVTLWNAGNRKTEVVETPPERR